MNLMINQRIIKKIQKLAEDERGDPKIRAIAQRKLAEFRLLNPNLFHEAEIWRQFHGEPRNPPNPRTQHSAEYAKFRFMNFDTWDTTSNGNRTTTLMIGETICRVLILSRKPSTWEWAWSASPTVSDKWIIGNRKFATIDEARRDAWDKLMTL